MQEIEVKQNVRQEKIDEGHLHEIFDMSVNGLFNWFTKTVLQKTNLKLVNVKSLTFDNISFNIG